MAITKITRPDGTVLVPVTIYLPEDEAKALNTLALSSAVTPAVNGPTMEVEKPSPNMVSAFDASKKLGMSHAHMCHMLQKGEVKGKKIGSRWYVTLPVTITNQARIGGRWKPVTLTLTETER